MLLINVKDLSMSKEYVNLIEDLCIIFDARSVHMLLFIVKFTILY